jgi:hypothetical protein
MKTPEPDFHDILNEHGRDEHRFLKLPQAHRGELWAKVGDGVKG